MGHSKFETDQQVTIVLFGKKINFYVLEDSFPIIEDGIIGLPCLNEYKFELSNDKLKLDDNVIMLQKEPTVQPGETLKQTVYLENKPTPVCFINGGESPAIITNKIEKSNEYEQISTFKNLVRLSHIEPSLKQPIEKLLLFYLDVFNLETDFLPCTNLAEHTITLRENKILNTKSTRMPQRRNQPTNERYA